MYSRYANRVNTERLPAVWKKLAAAPPKRRVALIRSLLPGIEAALTSGQNLKDIWEALETEGLHVNYHTFYMVVWRARGKPTAASSWGKRIEILLLAPWRIRLSKTNG